MSEHVLSSAVVAIVVYGCLPTLGIGVIWCSSAWIGSHWDNRPTAAQPEIVSGANAVGEPRG